MTFDSTTATPDEWREEAARRMAKREKKATVIQVDERCYADAPSGYNGGLWIPIVPPAITLAIPFALLVSDNLKMIPTVIRQGTRVYPRMILNPRYSKAKKLIRALVAKQLPEGWVPWPGRCTLEATLYEPNRSRTRDTTNFAKQVSDALTGLVYADDGQLDRSTWIRGAIDTANPHLALILSQETP
jgi:Holliday junction resolvase RusA-like endonuclease